MTHTQTPWRACGPFKYDGIETINIVAEDERHVCEVSSRPGENEANAAYIVHCVNSHSSLVEENKRMREALEIARIYVQERGKDDGYFHQEEASYDLAMIDKALGDTNA